MVVVANPNTLAVLPQVPLVDYACSVVISNSEKMNSPCIYALCGYFIAVCEFWGGNVDRYCSSRYRCPATWLNPSCLVCSLQPSLLTPLEEGQFEHHVCIDCQRWEPVRDVRKHEPPLLWRGERCSLGQPCECRGFTSHLHCISVLHLWSLEGFCFVINTRLNESRGTSCVLSSQVTWKCEF